MGKTSHDGASYGRIAGIDGMRGLFIAYIMAHHISRMESVSWISSILRHGSIGVDPFFMLSGFVLMLSFLSHGATFTQGVWGYIRARMYRLLPDYYAGLFFSCIIATSLPFFVMNGERIPWGIPSLWAIVVHALFLQNVLLSALPQINDNYWFFAMEMQLSLAFPLCAYAWKRFGTRWFVALAVASFAAAYIAFGPGSYFLKPQYAVLFVSGMLMAIASRSNRIRASSPWVWFSLAVSIIAALASVRVFLLNAGQVASVVFVADAMVGFATCSMIMACILDSPSPFRSLLEQPFLRWLGSISYALFLIHTPVLRVVHFWLLQAGIASVPRVAILYTAGIAASIVVAVIFRRVVDAAIIRWLPKGSMMSA